MEQARFWSVPIDAYCERIEASFWSEPVNAVSNGAFVLAAASAFALWRRSGRDDAPALALIVAMAGVGVGSFLFHTFANRWSLLADVVPIMVFIHGYFLLAMLRFLKLGPWAALAATVAFAAFGTGFVKGWETLVGTSDLATANGSVGYVPAALALIGVGGLLVIDSRRLGAPARAGRMLLAAAGVFALSLAFRSVDRAVCSWLPLGTHFLWHALNAVVLFMLLRVAIEARILTRLQKTRRERR